MVTFNSSTLLRENGNYLYTMQKGDSLYAIAAKLAKEQGGNATDICNDLIKNNGFTTKTDDATKTHVNKIPVKTQIKLGSQFATALTKYFESSSSVAMQNQVRRFGYTAPTGMTERSSYTDLLDADITTEEELKNQECADFPTQREVLAYDSTTRQSVDQIAQAPTKPKDPQQTQFSLGSKKTYTARELAALQQKDPEAAPPPERSAPMIRQDVIPDYVDSLRPESGLDLVDLDNEILIEDEEPEMSESDSPSTAKRTPPDPAVVAEVSGRGLLGLINTPKVQQEIADLLNTKPTSLDSTAAATAPAIAGLAPETIADNAQDVIPSEEDATPVTEDDEGEWTEDGTVEPRLSAQDRETLRHLREARGVEDPIGYDPLTGLNMTAYMSAYTDSERSELRKNLPYLLQELRAADRIEDLGKFDSTEFAAVKRDGFYVLLPFGLNLLESRDLADYLIRFNRTNPIATNRAFRMVSEAVLAKSQGLEGIMNEPISAETQAQAQNTQTDSSSRPAYELTDADYDELFDLDSGRKNALASNIPEK